MTYLVTDLATMKRAGIALSVITDLEVLEGVMGGIDPQRNQREFRSFLRGTRLIVVSRPIATRAALIRLDLRRQKRQVNERAMDILIATTAIEHGPTLVTRNTRDYADIPDLRLHDGP